MASVAMNLTQMSYSDKWNLYSMDLIGSMQKNLNTHEWWMVQASVFGDNRQAFTFFFPLVAGLLHLTGVKALWSAILVEWTNLLMKWIFMGDRPYWWSQSTPIYGAASRPKLNQYFNTCESGPGTPSGHLMMNVAIFYVISEGLIRHVTANQKRFGLFKKLFSLLITLSYGIWITLVFMSRLYIQTHFLHQCFLGAIIGYYIGKISSENKWLSRLSITKALILTVMIGGSSYGTFIVLKKYGMNPLWAIPMAKKYCSSLKFVKIETQPFFLMVRIVGATLGLSLGMSCKHNTKCPNGKGFVRSFFAAFLGLGLGQLVLIAQGMLPSDQLQLFLAGSFALYFMLTFCVSHVIPKFLHSILD